MDLAKPEKYIFNLKIAKRIGLYQILDPSSMKIRGYNAYCVVFFVVSLLIDFIPSTIFSSGLYFWRNDNLTFFFNIATLSNILFASFKIFMILYNSGKLRKCIDVTSFNFLSHYQYYNENLSKQTRKRVIQLTNAYGIFMISVSIMWTISPIILSGVVVKIKNADNSYNTYRLNMIGLYFPVSSETYNDHFFIFYFIEMIIVNSVIFFYFVTDILLVSLCLAFRCQMEKISEAIQLLGHNKHLTADYGTVFHFINIVVTIQVRYVYI